MSAVRQYISAVDEKFFESFEKIMLQIMHGAEA
jgi:hypothetical protein